MFSERLKNLRKQAGYSRANLATKLDRIRVNGYQEGDTTPIEDEENIRRHHTRDTVEKQFNETYCYLLKGVIE